MLGVIQEDFSVLGEDGKTYHLEGPRSIDDEGYPELLIDAKKMGYGGSFARQTIKPFIGASVSFVLSPTNHAYNFEVTKLKS